MVKMVLLLIVIVMFNSCYSISKIEYVNAEKAFDETLITVDSKTQKYGIIEFLQVEDGKFRLLEYSYLINKNSNTARCTMRSNELYGFDNGRLKKKWMTSSSFQKQLYYEQYFNFFSDNFLNMTNDEKIELLNKISSQK